MSKLPPKGYTELRTDKLDKKSWRVSHFWDTPYCVIPAGFTFDGASSPRITWFIVDPATEFFEAACLHDYLYRYAIFGHTDKARKRADKAFYDTALRYGANPTRAWLAYQAVRLGGGKYYGHLASNK